MSSQSGPPTGVVLAGGFSSRMGRDKAVLELDGVPLAERAAKALDAHCSEVLIADGGRRVLAGRTSIADGAARGPAAGILGAAATAPDRSLLVLACDLPLVPAALLALLVAARETTDWVVPAHAGGLEPLCSLYAPRALVALSEQVRQGTFGPHRLAERNDLEIRYLDEPTLAEIGDPETMFANLNRPEDLRRIEDSLGKGD